MKYVLLFSLFLAPFLTRAQLFVSENAEIGIVTIGPYQGEIWSAFGHTGIRVHDPERSIDWFFDYGVFDFEQQNFFLNFAKGLLKYKVVARQFDQSMAYHKRLNRSIKIQYLDLTPFEKQRIVEFLMINVEPERAEYLYNYVYDNCATKIPNVMQLVLGSRIVFDYSFREEGKTIRDLMDDYLEEQPWGDLGIDIGLGMQIDKEAEGYEYLFLPDYVAKSFEHSSIFRDEEYPLVTKSEILFTPEPEENRPSIFTPLNVFILLFFLIGFVTNKNFKTGRRTKWIDVALFSIVGFVGWWVTYLWFGTEHLSKWNLNILWAIPFHLPLALFISRSSLKGFMRIYFKVVAYWYCLLLVAWALLPQPLGMPLIPLVLAMVLRSFYISYDLRKELVASSQP